MKIAIFSDIFYPELSGITDSLIATGKELVKRGHEIDFFAPAYSTKDYKISGVPRYEEITEVNMRVHRITSTKANDPSGQGRAYIPSLAGRIFSQRKFDIIHSQTFFGAGIEALCLSKIKKLPLVGTNHTLIEAFGEFMPFPSFTVNFLKKYLIWYYNRADYVTVPSLFLLEDMKSKGLHVPIESLSNPIHNAFFEKADKNLLKKKLGLPQFTILYAGRISAEKNLRMLLESFILFAKKTPNACLVIIGHGVLRKELERRVLKSGVSGQIKIIGPFLGKNRSTLYEYFHAADAFVMPSTSETQSMATIQAMASGLPIITAKSGPLGEFTTKETGVQFEPTNMKELENIFFEFYAKAQSTNILNELGGNGRDFAQKFSVQVVADRWEKVYIDTIDFYKRKHGRK